MSHSMTQACLLRVLLIDMVRVEISGDPREEVDVGLADGFRDARLQPDLDLVDALPAHHHHALPALTPPSTKIVCPVMKRALSEARKVTTSATSSGSPIRRSGVCSIAALTRSGNCSMYAIVSGVLMMPGPTALTATPRGPHS